MAYFFTSVDRIDSVSESERRLKSFPRDEILVIEKEIDFSQIDHVFTDADGTIVTEGATSFAPEKIKLLRQLHENGIGVTIITGKPYYEVLGLRKSLPRTIPLHVLCEKGAYLATFDDKANTRQFVLSSPSLEADVATLKKIFFEHFAPTMTQKYGVHFGLSGSGAHTSVLGIDFYKQKPPLDYLQLAGGAREALKINDAVLIEKIESEITQFVKKYQPTWKVVHLGGANAEIAPASIDKDKAIEATREYQDARRVLVLGDSRNDHTMFVLSSTNPDKVTSGLIIHRRSALPLIRDVDLVAFGLANSDPILQAIIGTRNK